MLKDSGSDIAQTTSTSVLRDGSSDGAQTTSTSVLRDGGSDGAQTTSTWRWCTGAETIITSTLKNTSLLSVTL